MDLVVQIPRNKGICPVLDVLVYQFLKGKSSSENKLIYGMGQIDLQRYLKKIEKRREGVLGLLDEDGDDSMDEMNKMQDEQDEDKD